MHRYAPDTIARLRTDYVHELQSRYDTEMASLTTRMETATTAKRTQLNRKLNKITNQAEELRIYEEKIHHLADQMIEIDLDDGVNRNYAIFKDVLAKI
jgi:type II restriction/modification system DNA methylase subunit YeeA